MSGVKVRHTHTHIHTRTQKKYIGTMRVCERARVCAYVLGYVAEEGVRMYICMFVCMYVFMCVCVCVLYLITMYTSFVCLPPSLAGIACISPPSPATQQVTLLPDGLV